MKILKRIAAALAALVLLAGIGVYGLWHNEIRSAATIRQLNVPNEEHRDGAVYEMAVCGDYYFEDLLEQGGVSTDKELISFITGKITKGIIPMTIQESEIGCSSFTAQAADGDRIFARNYDMRKTNTMIVHTAPKGRHASVSTVDLGFISIGTETGIRGLTDKVLCLAAPFVPLDGINDAGVAVGIYMSYQGGERTVATAQDTERPDITSTTMIRMILDYADSVEEAVELVRAYDLHDSAGTSYHYMVADASGRSAILEWVSATDAEDNDGSQRELVVTWNELPYQVVTNFIVADGYYENDEDRHGYDRYSFLVDALTEREGRVEDNEDAMDLLSCVGQRGFNGPEHLTIHSVIYNLTEQSVIWIGNEHYGEPEYIHTMALK